MYERFHLFRSDRSGDLSRQLGLSVLLGLSVHGLAHATSAPALAPADSVEAATKALQSGMAEQAQQLITNLRKQAPEDARVRFLQGVLLAQQGRADQAIDTFRQLTRSHPQLSEPFNNLGVLLASKGQLAPARAAFEQALLTHPSLATAHRNLLDVQTQLAQESYARALMLDKTRVAPPQLTLLAGIHSPQADTAPARGSVLQAGAMTAVASAPAVVTTSASSAASNASPSVPVAARVTASATRIDAPAARPLASAPPSPPTPPTVVSKPAPVSPAASAPTRPAAAPVVTASAPAASASAAAPAASDPAAVRETRLKEQLDAWAKAWSRQDMKAYLAAYARDFQPPAGMSRSQWEADRALKITSKKRIQVEISQLRISWREEQATVQFRQAYESDNLKVVSRKTMSWALRDGQWRILRETTG